MKKQILGLIVGLVATLLFPALTFFADDIPAIPAGTTLQVRLTTTLSTRTNQNGDPWVGKVLEPIIANGEEIVPAGSTVEGRVTFVKQPARVKGVGQMRLVLDKVTTLEGMQFSASVEIGRASCRERG